MFAVPGWNVSADKLKTETEKSDSQKKKDKKRKQRERQQEAEKSFNVPLKPRVAISEPKKRKADDEKPARDESKKKRRKPDSEPKASVPGNVVEKDVQSKKYKVGKSEDTRRKGEGESVASPQVNGDDEQAAETKKRRREEKKKRKDERRASGSQTARANGYDTEATEGTHAGQQPVQLIAPAAVKLTPLQSAMRAKLMGSRFRHLNESLYTKPSAESLKIFSENPIFFNEYHAGFRQQVSSWPENPVDVFFQELKARARAGETKSKAYPLPRVASKCKVADLGCGDAALAKKAQSIPKEKRVTVDSYDLQSTEPSVIKADIAHLPAKDDSVNVAIFCLALMGTNWIEFIEEAWRVMHWKGELWIAEIKSRFSRTKRRPPEHSVGKKRKPNKEELKKQKQASEQADAERTIAEMDGSAEAMETTDVSGFVEVLKKRGFELVEDGVDLSNKMFVRMKFRKNMVPVKGKYAGQGAKKKNWREMLREGEDDGVDGAGVLQPCLYKLR